MTSTAFDRTFLIPPHDTGPPGQMKTISGPKLKPMDQGPLTGVLKEVGYDESQASSTSSGVVMVADRMRTGVQVLESLLRCLISLHRLYLLDYLQVAEPCTSADVIPMISLPFRVIRLSLSLSVVLPPLPNSPLPFGLRKICLSSNSQSLEPHSRRAFFTDRPRNSRFLTTLPIPSPGHHSIC